MPFFRLDSPGVACPLQAICPCHVIVSFLWGRRLFTRGTYRVPTEGPICPPVVHTCVPALFLQPECTGRVCEQQSLSVEGVTVQPNWFKAGPAAEQQPIARALAMLETLYSMHPGSLVSIAHLEDWITVAYIAVVRENRLLLIRKLARTCIFIAVSHVIHPCHYNNDNRPVTPKQRQS